MWVSWPNIGPAAAGPAGPALRPCCGRLLSHTPSVQLVVAWTTCKVSPFCFKNFGCLLITSCHVRLCTRLYPLFCTASNGKPGGGLGMRLEEVVLWETKTLLVCWCCTCRCMISETARNITESLHAYPWLCELEYSMCSEWVILRLSKIYPTPSPMDILHTYLPYQHKPWHCMYHSLMKECSLLKEHPPNIFDLEAADSSVVCYC